MMTDSLRIDGARRVLINDGPTYIEFDPSDVLFAERFYALMGELDTEQEKFTTRLRELDADGGNGKDGMPSNMPARLQVMREACDFFRGKIDQLFGEGTSQAVFGDSRSMMQIRQFFQGLTTFIGEDRTKRVAKYTARKDKQEAVMP
jgi:hypothetical protein